MNDFNVKIYLISRINLIVKILKIQIYKVIFMSDKNRYVTIFWEIGWTDLYDFWDQDKGGTYLGSHINFSPKAPGEHVKRNLKIRDAGYF